MIYAYELSFLNINKKIKGIPTKDDYSHLRKRVKTILNKTGFDESSLLHGRILERLALLGSNEINIIHRFCTKLERKLN